MLVPYNVGCTSFFVLHGLVVIVPQWSNFSGQSQPDLILMCNNKLLRCILCMATNAHIYMLQEICYFFYCTQFIYWKCRLQHFLCYSSYTAHFFMSRCMSHNWQWENCQTKLVYRKLEESKKIDTLHRKANGCADVLWMHIALVADVLQLVRGVPSLQKLCGDVPFVITQSHWIG